MRYGVAISVLLHGVIVALIVVGLPVYCNRKTRGNVDCRRNHDTRCANQETRPKKTDPPKPELPKAVEKPTTARPAPDPPPAPKSVPEPKAEPLPKPKPKPKAKPAPPKPKPKPKEVKVASKTPPVPRPKRRPKPPRDEFQSLLKNLAKEQKQRKSDPPKKQQKIAKRAPEKQQRSPLEHRRSRAGWCRPSSSRFALLENPGGRQERRQNAGRDPDAPQSRRLAGAVPQIQDQGASAETFFPGGRRKCVARCAIGVRADQAPYEHYDIWREIVFTFQDARTMRLFL